MSDARLVRLHARIGAALQNQVAGAALSPERTVEFAYHLMEAVPVIGPSAALDQLTTAADDALTRLAAVQFTEFLTIARRLTDQTANPDLRPRQLDEIGARHHVGRLLWPGGQTPSVPLHPPSVPLHPPSFDPTSTVPVDPDQAAEWHSSWRPVTTLQLQRPPNRRCVQTCRRAARRQCISCGARPVGGGTCTPR